MRSTLELLLELVGQVRELARVELSLAQAEVGERARRIPSSLTALVVGIVLLAGGLGLLMIAAGLALGRFGVPHDLAFLIVAGVAIVVSAILMRVGAAGLKPSQLVPARSLSQISSLIGGL